MVGLLSLEQAINMAIETDLEWMIEDEYERPTCSQRPEIDNRLPVDDKFLLERIKDNHISVSGVLEVDEIKLKGIKETKNV